MPDPQALSITAPSRETAEMLAGRLSEFAQAELTDGEIQGCRVIVPDPSADVFNRTLAAVSAWLEDADLASVELHYDGDHYVVEPRTTFRLGLDS